MKKQLSNVSLVIGLMLALSAFSASANDEIGLRARLNGAQEVPSISTLGSGDFKARIDSQDSVSFRLSYENLEGGEVLFAHIHLGQRGVNGGVMTFLCGGGGKPACLASPATVEGTITPADIIGPAGQGISPGEFDEFVRALGNGTAYVNVHTETFSNGEIRGQVKDDKKKDDKKKDDKNGHDRRDGHDHQDGNDHHEVR